MCKWAIHHHLNLVKILSFSVLQKHFRNCFTFCHTRATSFSVFYSNFMWNRLTIFHFLKHKKKFNHLLSQNSVDLKLQVFLVTSSLHRKSLNILLILLCKIPPAMWTSILKSCHRFQIIFRSGLWLGHSNTWQKHWKANLQPSLNCFAVYNRLLPRFPILHTFTVAPFIANMTSDSFLLQFSDKIKQSLQTSATILTLNYWEVNSEKVGCTKVYLGPSE